MSPPPAWQERLRPFLPALNIGAAAGLAVGGAILVAVDIATGACGEDDCGLRGFLLMMATGLAGAGIGFGIARRRANRTEGPDS